MRSPLLRPATARGAALRAAALGASAVAAAASLLLTACTPAQPGTGGGGDAAGPIAVVASTNVYGDLVETIGGDRVAVTSIVTKPTQDPHSYEATAQDRLAVSKARLVVENGGGFDPFLGPLVQEAKLGDSAVITAVQVAGLEAGGAHTEGAHSEGTHTAETSSAAADPHAGHNHAFNEHVWYDVHAMSKVVTEIAERLGALEPASAEKFSARAVEITARLEAVEVTLEQVKAAHGGKTVVMTEPVPFYLLEAAGLENATPEAFTEAIEEEQDVPPAALKETLDLVSSKGVALLAYNKQTEGPQTQAVRKAAEDAGVNVVEFTETLPEGSDYAAWMQANAEAVAKALA
ncbi:metal ABC transporter solute-binding protein, Zn/Mn family [Sinomonas mesophila]|uniref:metal ABC transporter solute-binding protein, Zn/Mn family n=1 Tax=Sinomonas mesophila TaxID=1531955 RepID=UPI001FE4D486|nr:zinc ABC transporter substrate-binding protein [Sinomonas mesophila]